jgi:uncharacterized integral membrane protein
MAKALQCPNCGKKTNLAGFDPGSTFACEQCGQVLKVPPSVARRGASSASSGAATPPAPRRGARPVMTAGRGAPGGATAVLSAPAPGGAARPPVVPPPVAMGARQARVSGRDQLPLVVRILAWVIALPLGLAIVGFPARRTGFLTSQDLLDVIVERDLGRFLPLVVVVLLWALVSAILVTLFVEGGRRLVLRRQDSRARGASGEAELPSTGPPPPPRRRGS